MKLRDLPKILVDAAIVTTTVVGIISVAGAFGWLLAYLDFNVIVLALLKSISTELYCDHGCWSGYPPHKHDEDQGGAETAHEEVYHFRFRPETGFGAQLAFQPDGSSQCFMTRNGDTFLLDKGYHPTVTSPGHEEYIFTILVGKTQRGLVQNFKEEHRHLMRGIPGIEDMVNKFK